MKLVYMGTPEFAVPILESLVEAGHNIVAVVTQPDRPAGRGRAPVASPVKIAAERLGLPVLQAERVREKSFVEHLSSLQAEAIVVAAFGQILPRSLLDLAPLGAINVHASLLPDLRGASPISEAIARGYRQTGVTIMLMNEGLDTGPILSQRRVDIAPNDTTESLCVKLAEVGAELLLDTLPAWAGRKIEPRPQDDSAASYAKQITKEDGHLDWTQPAAQLERLCRAYYPWPGCYGYWGDKVVKFLEVEVAEATAESTPPGCVVETQVDGGKEKWPAVSTGHGLLIIRTLQLAGRRPMSGPEFLRGNRGFVGSCLG